jgi:uncharacterized protein YndB with AHSA1/START domain
MPGRTETVEHEIQIRARPETVFAYFTDPARMVQWMGTAATLDPRPGGECRITMSRAIGEATVRGRFEEVDPYTRVVFTWGWEDGFLGVPPATSRVEVDLVPEDGGTRVRIEHRSLPAAAVGDHVAGWRHYFERLRLVAEGRDPGPDEFVVPSVAAQLAPDD